MGAWPGGPSAYQVLRGELMYSHRLIRRYFPVRFYLFYPAYLYLAVRRALDFLQTYGQGPRTASASLLLQLLAALPRALGEVWPNARRTPFRPIPGFVS